ncbi:hypothetical protein [Nocardia huaxiensis]|uniref:Uncharacterized protein n=1 Tax=Nocardia huaxiensis TaxID=2755382 RepID=A0A7D6Z1Q8_9NOCA|nr:hypothetical protein [Nocardia huaxiensis]QLY30526.1 hypothetical protein H0264_36355 [Nocardia huaxiensis]UFS95873.1 hypothetical protein LPY97_35325 [Nocardia huaxiensis]
MTAPPRTGHDGKQAVLVLAAVAALVGIPTLIASRVPVRESVVPAGTAIELESPGEEPDSVTFAGVDGWIQRTTGDPATAVLESPNRTVLIVTVVNGVTDFGEAAEWRLKVLDVQGFTGEFDGGMVANPHGFHGFTCRGADNPGVCAVVGKQNLAVTLALAGDRATFAELAPILESLEAEQ